MTVQEVIGQLIARSRPVLLPDTCSLLDVLSGPKRIRGQELRSAVRIWEATGPPDPGVVIVLAQLVWGTELGQRRVAAEAAFREYANRWQEDTLTCQIFAEALGDKAPDDAGPFIDGMQKSLADVYEGLVSASIRLDRELDCEERATERERRKIPPAHRKGAHKDATILEQYLKFCRELRAAGFTEAIIFLTSNKNDFCDDDGRTLHSQLVADFGSVGLNLCLDWANARTSLKL